MARVLLGNLKADCFMGVCETAADVADKTVSIQSFFNQIGRVITVRFLNNNTATGITLNVNNSGAFPIKCGTQDGSFLIVSNGLYNLCFDGNSWQIVNNSATVASRIRVGQPETLVDGDIWIS